MRRRRCLRLKAGGSVSRLQILCGAARSSMCSSRLVSRIQTSEFKMMRIRKIFAALFLSLAAGGALAQSADAPAAAPLTAEDVNAWLDGYVPYALHTGDIAG